MIIEISVAAVAVAFVVLVGFLVPALIELRRTILETKRLMVQLEAEIPILVKEVRMVTENLNAVTDQARDGVEHATLLLHAVGEFGESVHEMHRAVRGKSLALFSNLASMVAGVRAASSVFKQRVHVHKQGGNSDGQR